MSRKIWIIGLIILLVVTAGYVYFQKPDILNSVSEFVVEKPRTEIKVVKTKTAAYLIADPTGSTYLNYAIPQIDISFISSIADTIYKNGGGYLWLSYIDNDSKNNNVLYVKINASGIKTLKPERVSGETYNEYDKRIKKYEIETNNFRQDSLGNYNKYLVDKKNYLELCSELLSKIYVKGSPETQWSDVIGSLNAATYSLNTLEDNSIKKYIVCFSDLQQDTPHLHPQPVLKSIPSDIKILAVNPIPGSSKMVTNDLIVLNYPTRVLDYIINDNKGGI